MKAVNLIPPENAKGGAPRIAVATGGPIGSYVVLAVLAVVVVMVGASALTNKQVSDKKAELARVQNEAQAAEAKAAALKPYTAFAALREARVETVGGLLDGRFDWAHSLREVARVVPSDVDLTSLVGTVSPTSKVGGGGGAGSLRTALAVPAVDLIGCAGSQARVATLLARLRAIDGVQRVTLASSEKVSSASPSDSDCRATPKMPQFQVTVFYKAPEGITPAADAAAAAASSNAAAAANPASAGGAK
jgi:Tfp pilus assembly protein PilN